MPKFVNVFRQAKTLAKTNDEAESVYRKIRAALFADALEDWDLG